MTSPIIIVSDTVTVSKESHYLVSLDMSLVFRQEMWFSGLKRFHYTAHSFCRKPTNTIPGVCETADTVQAPADTCWC